MRVWMIVVSAAILVACSPPPNLPPTALSAPQVAAPAPTPPSEPEKSPDLKPAAEAPQIADDSQIVKQLQVEMAEKEVFAKELWSAAGQINDYNHVGTFYNEYHIPEHSCFILGRLVGKSGVVKGLEIEYKPDYITATTENAQDLRVMHNSLVNFNSVAKHLIKLSRDERVLQWNLDCVGQFNIPRSAYIEQNGQSSFYVIKNEGKLLQVLGDIEPGFAQKVIDAVEKTPTVEVVALGSGGGYLQEALRAGNYIRSKSLETTLWNNCYSACPFVFMAGTQRTNWSPYSDLGFHQIYTPDGKPIPLDSAPYREIYAYLVRMGIDPHFVLTQMWSASPQDMAMVDGYDEALCAANITTWVQRGCTSKDYKSRY